MTTTKIRTWLKDAGQTIDRDNPRQIALYLGLCCEELSEALEECSPDYAMLRHVGDLLKQGKYDGLVDRADREELLDASIDLIWVATGLAASLGADVEGALAEVVRSNDSKRMPDGRLHVDANGKVVKGPAYSAPKLAPYLPR